MTDILTTIGVIEINTVIPKRKKPVVAPITENTYYPEDIALMNDYELANIWIQITGRTHLSCKHCNGEKPIVPYWINSIRKRCMKKTWAGSKGGLHKDIIVPSTCDAMQSRNYICNPVNNPVYSKLRSVNINNDSKKDAIKKRETELAAIGLKTKSYKYIL